MEDDIYLTGVHYIVNDHLLLGTVTWSSIRRDLRIVHLIFSITIFLQYGRLEILNVVRSFMYAIVVAVILRQMKARALKIH